MFSHQVFIDISRSFWGGGTSPGGLLFRSENTFKRFSEHLELITGRSGISMDEKARLKHLLQALFPQSHTKEPSGEAINGWKRDFRICDEMAFYKYFQITIDTGKPTAQEIARLIAISNDRTALVDTLKEAIERKTIEDLLDFVFVTREDIPINNVATVATALFDIGDTLPEPKPSMFGVGLDVQLTRIIYHRLKNEPQDESTRILWDAFQRTTGFIVPLRFLALEDKRVRERGEKTSYVINEAKLDDFINLALERIRGKANDWSLLDDKECGFVLWRWREWANPDEVTAWLTGAVENPSRAIKILRAMITETTINGVIKVPKLHGTTVEKMIDLQLLNENASNAPADLLTDEDKKNLSLLSEAVRRKQAGLDYSELEYNEKGF